MFYKNIVYSNLNFVSDSNLWKISSKLPKANQTYILTFKLKLRAFSFTFQNGNKLVNSTGSSPA